MDHSSAHLTEFSTEPTTTVVESLFTKQEKEETNNKSEHLMHNKEQHQQSAYYKKLGDRIKNYHEVVLFGPTDAKKELHNLLKADHHFANIKIDVKRTNKMTEGEQHTFVHKHFSKH